MLPVVAVFAVVAVWRLTFERGAVWGGSFVGGGGTQRRLFLEIGGHVGLRLVFWCLDEVRVVVEGLRRKRRLGEVRGVW